MTTCWIITENLIGTRNQCLALAHALDLQPIIKTIALRQPWKTFTPWIRHFTPSALTSSSHSLIPTSQETWPDIIIASGRKAIAAALWVKKQTRGAAKLVIIQSPVIHDRNFDLVIAPRHDGYTGDHVLPVTGALSVVSTETLDMAKHTWADRLGTLPAPRVTVLIGGNSRTHRITEQRAIDITDALRDLMLQGCSLMITASRRTPAPIQKMMRAQLQGDNVHFWDGNGDNPYHAYLAWADVILVTEDSVSMACEAVSTGKPVYIIPLEGGSKRFKRFHNHLIQKNYARWFDGSIDHWSYTPPNDLALAAEKVKTLIS